MVSVRDILIREISTLIGYFKYSYGLNLAWYKYIAILP